jgi:hypothetical protein
MWPNLNYTVPVVNGENRHTQKEYEIISDFSLLTREIVASRTVFGENLLFFMYRMKPNFGTFFE